MKKLISIIKKIDFRIYAILIAFSLSIFFLLTLSLAKYSQKQNHYKFYITNNNSIVYIDEIKIGGGEVKLDKYDSKALTYDEDEKRLLIKPNKKGLFLSINNSKIDNLSIKFSSDGGKAIIDIERDNKPIDSLVFKDNNKYNEYYVEDIYSTISLIKSSFSNLSVGDIILYVFLMIISLAISYFAIMYIYSFILDLGKKKFSIKQSIISMILLFFINLEYLYVLQQFVSWLCIIPMFVMLLVALIYLKNILDKKPHYAFALIAMFVGVLFILLLPPLHLPDEMKHTTKSYELSYGVKNETVFYEDGKRYAYIPKDLQSFYDKYGSQVQNADHKIGTRTYLYDLFKRTNYNN